MGRQPDPYWKGFREAASGREEEVALSKRYEAHWHPVLQRIH